MSTSEKGPLYPPRGSLAARSGSEVSELQDDSPTTLDRPRFPEEAEIPQTRPRPVGGLVDASIPVTRSRSVEGLRRELSEREADAEPRPVGSSVGVWVVLFAVAVFGGLAGAAVVLWLAL